MVNQTYGVAEPYSLSGFLFYPFAFIRVSGSYWIAALLLCSFVAALQFRKDKKITFLITFIVIQILIGEIHHTKLDRHIFPALPAFFLLAGYVLAQWVEWAKRSEIRARLWLPWLVTGGMLCVSLNAFIDTLHPSTNSYDSNVVDYVAAAVSEKDKTLVIGSMEMLNPTPPALDWDLVANEHLMVAAQSGVSVNGEEVQKLAHGINDRRVPTWLRNIILPVVSRGQQPLGLRSLYLGLPSQAAYSQSPEGLARYLRVMASSHSFDCAIVIASLAPDARYPATYADSGLREIGLYRVSTREFDGGNVRVDVYRRP
jgi:general stress protein CsbA